MKVVIMGGRNRREPGDFNLVNKLLDELKVAYPKLFIVTTGCDRGIGKIIRNRLLPVTKGGKPEIEFEEVSLRIYLQDTLPKSEMVQLFLARNACLYETGDEFYLFPDSAEYLKGMVGDLRDRLEAGERPYVLYRPGSQDPEYCHWNKPR